LLLLRLLLLLLLLLLLQCRGSIPLLWTQLPNIKYKPPTKLLEGSVTSSAFDTHIDAMLKEYKV
jgi:hypothetical protein